MQVADTATDRALSDHSNGHAALHLSVKLSTGQVIRLNEHDIARSELLKVQDTSGGVELPLEQLEFESWRAFSGTPDQQPRNTLRVLKVCSTVSACSMACKGSCQGMRHTGGRLLVSLLQKHPSPLNCVHRTEGYNKGTCSTI